MLGVELQYGEATTNLSECEVYTYMYFQNLKHDNLQCFKLTWTRWSEHMNTLLQVTAVGPQSLDTDVQRPFYSVATVALLFYYAFLIWEENDGGHVE